MLAITTKIKVVFQCKFIMRVLTITERVFENLSKKGCTLFY